MYKVTLYDRGSYPNGGQVLLDTSSQDFNGIKTATDEGKLNEAGSFTFSIALTHSLYEIIEPLKTYVSVEEDGDEIFWGRVLMVRKSPLTGIKQVTCEGALAFLLDAELAPDTDVRNMSVKDYFTFCVNAYNSAIGNDKARNLIPGTVTVRKQNESVPFKNGSWTPIQSVIKSKLVDTRDGFLRIRRKEGSYEHYLDWVRQVGNENPQTIQITQNVINQTSTESGEDIFTFVRGLGKDNLSYGPVRLSQGMETKYGKIIRTITFGDVDSQSELQTKVEDYIDKLKNRISLSADINFVDMHYLDGTSPKVKLGDVFTHLSGYEGTKYIAASLTKDLLNPANDKMSPKTDKDLMPSITSSGANSGSVTGNVSGSRSFSGGSSHWYKHIHETEEDLALTARNIEITAEENIRLLSSRVDIQADNLSSLSGRVVTVEGKWTTFEGTGLYQNRQSIDAVAGKFMIDNSGTLLLKSGTQFKLDANGSSTNVGHLLVVDDNRGKTHDVGQLLASYAGSYSYQNDSELGAIVGRYQLDTTVDPTNPWTEVTPASGASTDGINPQERGWWVKNSNGKYVRTTDTTVVSGRKYYIPNSQTKVVFDSGAGYKIRENGAEWGIYTEGNLDGGLIVEKINGDVNARIEAANVKIGRGTSTVTLAEAMTIDSGVVNIKKSAIVQGNLEIEGGLSFSGPNSGAIEAGAIHGTYISTDTGDADIGGNLDCGSLSIDGTPVNVVDISFTKANTLTVTYADGTTQDFSKATTLEGAWSSGTLNVNAYQTNGNTRTRVGTYASIHSLSLNGMGQSNFSVEMKTHDTGDADAVYTLRDSKYIYLHENVNGVGSNVTAGENSDGTSPIGYISTRATYDAGKLAGNTEGRAEYKALVRTRFGSASSGQSVSYFIEGYENTSGYASISGSSTEYKLGVSGSEDTAVVQIQNLSGTRLSNTAELSIGQLYIDGYNTGNANRGSRLLSPTVVTSTVDTTLSIGTRYNISSQYRQADGTWASGGSTVVGVPAVASRFMSGSNNSYYIESYEVTSSATSVPGSTYDYKLGITGEKASSVVRLLTVNNGTIANTPTLNVGSLYILGQNDLKDAGGAVGPIETNGTTTLNQYVTKLTVEVPSSAGYRGLEVGKSSESLAFYNRILASTTSTTASIGIGLNTGSVSTGSGVRTVRVYLGGKAGPYAEIYDYRDGKAAERASIKSRFIHDGTNYCIEGYDSSSIEASRTVFTLGVKNSAVRILNSSGNVIGSTPYYSLSNNTYYESGYEAGHGDGWNEGGATADVVVNTNANLPSGETSNGTLNKWGKYVKIQPSYTNSDGSAVTITTAEKTRYYKIPELSSPKYTSNGKKIVNAPVSTIEIAVAANIDIASGSIKWYDGNGTVTPPSYDASLSTMGSKIQKGKLGYIYFTVTAVDDSKVYRIPIDTR